MEKLLYDKNYFDSVSQKGIFAFKKYKRLLEKEIVLKNLTILDLGCAQGNFIAQVSKKNKCYGIDISKYAINKCKKKFPKIRKNFEVLDLNKNALGNPNLKFDLITMFDVIEHLDNYIYLKEIIENNLKSGGFLVITTPNANSILRFWRRSIFTGEMDTTHKHLFTPYTLDFFLRRLGLKKKVIFAPFPFFFRKNFITKNFLFSSQIFAIYKK